ncbi:MAG TPA: polysaccharide biosynthesis C-terminal domain-containing protein [Candidatus Baltobacteraceae bacterium]
MQFRARDLVHDGLFTFVIQSLTIVGSLAVGVLTARVLGPAGKGVYAMPVVQAGLVASLFSGLSSAASYYLLNEKAGRRIVAPLTVLTLCFVAISAVAVAIIAWLGNALWAAPAAIASLPAAAAIFAVRGYVTGIKKVRYVSTISVSTVLATLAFTVAGFLAISHSPAIAIVAWVASTTIVGAVAWIAMLVHSRTLENGSPIRLSDFTRFSVKGGATALVSLLNYRADLYIVAIMLPVADLGLYSVATSAPQALLFPAQVASIVASPHIGGLDKRAAANLTARCVRHSLLVSVVICMVVFAIAPIVIKLFYGAPFLPLVPSLRVMLIGVIALAAAGPISSYYTLKLAKPEIPLVVAGISAVICIAGTVILIPHFGIVGAASASSGAYVITQILSLWYFRRATGIGLRSMLVPTAVDLRSYVEIAFGLFRDCTRLLRRTAGVNG